MLTKTYTTKVERCVITLGESEITEAILDWLIKHGYHKKIERDKNSFQEKTELDLLEDNTAVFTNFIILNNSGWWSDGN